MEEMETSLLSTGSADEEGMPAKIVFPTAAEDLWHHERTKSHDKRKRGGGRFLCKMKRLTCPVSCLLQENEPQANDAQTVQVQMSSDSHIVPLEQPWDHGRVTTEASRRGLLGKMERGSSHTFSIGRSDTSSSLKVEQLESNLEARMLAGSSSSISWNPPFPDPENVPSVTAPPPQVTSPLNLHVFETDSSSGDNETTETPAYESLLMESVNRDIAMLKTDLNRGSLTKSHRRHGSDGEVPMPPSPPDFDDISCDSYPVFENGGEQKLSQPDRYAVEQSGSSEDLEGTEKEMPEKNGKAENSDALPTEEESPSNDISPESDESPVKKTSTLEGAIESPTDKESSPGEEPARDEDPTRKSSADEDSALLLQQDTSPGDSAQDNPNASAIGPLLPVGTNLDPSKRSSISLQRHGSAGEIQVLSVPLETTPDFPSLEEPVDDSCRPETTNIEKVQSGETKLDPQSSFSLQRHGSAGEIQVPQNPLEITQDTHTVKDKEQEEVAKFPSLRSLVHDEIPNYVSVPPPSRSHRRRGGRFLPLPCICGRGKFCCGVSAAFHMLDDPRACFTKVPKLRKDTFTHNDMIINRLRECFLSSLLSPQDVESFDDSTEKKFVANHHFHPELVSWSTAGNRCEIPMFVSGEEMKDLCLELSEDCRVLDENQMPTDGYYVVANYDFDETKKDLRRAIKVQRIVGEKKSSKRKSSKRRSSRKKSSKESRDELLKKLKRLSSKKVSEEEPIQLHQPISSGQAPPPLEQEIIAPQPPTRDGLHSSSRINQLRKNKNESLKKFQTLSSHFGDSAKREPLTGRASSLPRASHAIEQVPAANQVLPPRVEAGVVERSNEDSSGNESPTSQVAASFPSGEDTKEHVGITDNRQETEQVDTERRAASFMLPSLPPKPTFLDPEMNDNKTEFYAKLSSFEKRRRSAYALQMMATCMQWRSSLNGFEAGLNQTASAEHWVYEAANATQAIVQNTILQGKSQGTPTLQVLSENDKEGQRLPVFSGYVSSCISEDLSQARRELETKVNDMEKTGKSIIAELEAAETRVIEAWDTFNVNIIGSTESIASNPSVSPARFEASKLRYRVAVSSQSLAWKMSTSKLSRLFESVEQTERDRRGWLRGLLIEVVSRIPSCRETEIPLQKMEEMIQDIAGGGTSSNDPPPLDDLSGER